MKTHKLQAGMLLAISAGMSGCVSINSPMVQQRLKTMSAGIHRVRGG
jgi:hypothetical protein